MARQTDDNKANAVRDATSSKESVAENKFWSGLVSQIRNERGQQSTVLQSDASLPPLELISVSGAIKGMGKSFLLSQTSLKKKKAEQIEIEGVINSSPIYGIVFTDLSEKKRYAALVFAANINQPSFMGTWLIDDMDNDDDTAGKTNGPKLRPRWAEEARPKKQVKLRLEPDLISEVESAADSEGVTRNDWIEETIRKALKLNKT